MKAGIRSSNHSSQAKLGAGAMCTKRRSNVGGCRPDSGNPFLHGLGDELRVIVGTNVLRDATQEEEIGEHVDDIDGFQLSVDSSGSTANQRMTAPGDLRPISGWLAAHWHASLARFGPHSHFIWQNWRAGAVLLANSNAWLGEPKTTLNKINRASRIIFGNQQSELCLGKKSANVGCNVEGLQPVGLCELLGRVDAAFCDASNRQSDFRAELLWA